MSHQKDREEFIRLFSQEFPKAGPDDAKTLLKLAHAEQVWNEIQCSVNIPDDDRAKRERDSANRSEEIRRILSPLGGKLIENGDPRGFPYLIACPSGLTNDWGRRGLGIPAEGMTADALRRLEAKYR